MVLSAVLWGFVSSINVVAPKKQLHGRRSALLLKTDELENFFSGGPGLSWLQGCLDRSQRAVSLELSSEEIVLIVRERFELR